MYDFGGSLIESSYQYLVVLPVISIHPLVGRNEDLISKMKYLRNENPRFPIIVVEIEVRDEQIITALIS